jgi:hypothetical protein
VPVSDDNGTSCWLGTKPKRIVHELSVWWILIPKIYVGIQFTIILLVWHLIAVVTIEAAEHCAFSLLTVSSFIGMLQAEERD